MPHYLLSRGWDRVEGFAPFCCEIEDVLSNKSETLENVRLEKTMSLARLYSQVYGQNVENKESNMGFMQLFSSDYLNPLRQRPLTYYENTNKGYELLQICSFVS